MEIKKGEVKIVKLTSGELGEALLNELINVIDSYSGSLNLFELVGIIEVLKEELYHNAEVQDG